MIPATSLGNEHHPGLIGVYLELIPSEVGMKVYRSLGTDSVRGIRVFIDLYFQKCTEMAEVSRESITMNKTLGVPEESDFERANTPATKTAFQTPKLKSVAQVEKESVAPVMTKTHDEDDVNKGYRIQPWELG